MSDSQRKYFSGNSIEQALLQAASHFGIPPDRLAFKQLDKRHGFLRKRRGVIIEVDPDAPEKKRSESTGEGSTKQAGPPDTSASETKQPGRKGKMPQRGKNSTTQPWHVRPEDDGTKADELDDEDSVSDEPSGAEAKEKEPAEVDTRGEEVTRQEQRPAEAPRKRAERSRGGRGWRDVEIDEALVEAAGEALEEIFEVADLELEYEVSAGDGRLEIELSGDDEEALLEDRGSLLLAIQHLLPRLVRGLCGRTAPCRVDCDDFLARNERELEELALKVAREVKSRGEARTLQPMNPAERRIIHLTLADDQDVETESQGKGFFKRVAIRPQRRRPRGFDRYS